MIKVAVFGVPRSGTTWLGELLNSHPDLIYRYQPLFSYEFKSALNEDSTTKDVANFYEQIRGASSDFVLRERGFEKSDEPVGVVFKEVRYLHLIPLLLSAGVNVIFIRRHPVDVLNSWYQAPKEFDPDWDIREEWLRAPRKNLGRTEEFYGLSGWIRAQQILESIALNLRHRLHILEYEELRENPLPILSEVFKFLGLGFHLQSERFLIETTSIQKEGVYEVYRTKRAPLALPQPIVDLILAESEVLRYLSQKEEGGS